MLAFSISLDGFSAGPDQSLENPLGVMGTGIAPTSEGCRQQGLESKIRAGSATALLSRSASLIEAKARLRREDLRQKVDEDANFRSEAPASGMDRADRERVPLMFPQDAAHLTRSDRKIKAWA